MIRLYGMTTKSNPACVIFVDISTTPMKFCISKLLNKKIYTLSIIKFCWIYWIPKVTKLCCFNQDTLPHFLAFRALSSSVVSWWLWKEPVCWWWDEDADYRDGESYCRCMEWPSLAATDMYAFKRLVKFVTALLMCSCGSSSQMVCRLQGDFQHINRLRLRLEFIVHFQHGTPDVIV